jgi:hypothetical protein
VPPPDLFITYMNADTPRLVRNEAGVHHLNSVHGLYLAAGTDPQAARLLPLASLNSVTLLGAETVGRAYGGGMLKLEPREADELPVPSWTAIQHAAAELHAVREEVETALSRRDLACAVETVDRALLQRALGMSALDIRRLGDASRELAGRRLARGRTTPRG